MHLTEGETRALIFSFYYIRINVVYLALDFDGNRHDCKYSFHTMEGNTLQLNFYGDYYEHEKGFPAQL